MLADERAAIASLDHDRLGRAADHKLRVARELDALRARLAPGSAPELRAVFAALRAETRTNAILAATAAQAVRKLLGYETTGSYDRRARQTMAPRARTLATY